MSLIGDGEGGLMNRLFIEFHEVSFAYESQSEATIRNLSLQFTTGWTGIVGANGVGKSTLLQLAVGQLQPVSGRVQGSGQAIYCQQRTDSVPERFFDLIQDSEREAQVLKGELGIGDDWFERWETLSHGERKRAQIGTALWQKPDLLAIDEPTNHLDAAARTVLMSALQSFTGIGLIVSHDRQLLDTLCDACLFIDPPDFKIFPGNFSAGWEQLKLESKTLEKQEWLARKEFKKLDREVSKRRAEAAKADRKRSKRGMDRKDHDAKSKMDFARMTGKDAVAGKLLNQMQGRIRQAQGKLESLAIKKTYETGIWQQGERSHRNTLFTLEAGSLPLGADRFLNFPRLEMKPADRIALTGPNGCGKSTLIRHLIAILSLPKNRITYLPQEVDSNTAKQILVTVKNLPADKLGYVMTFVNRLGTRPPRLLESTDPSPGEVRKILLALGAADIPHLIVMDEPTNHLDLLSIECLKESLEDFPAGLLLVSHDLNFLDQLTRICWQITPDPADDNQYLLDIV